MLSAQGVYYDADHRPVPLSIRTLSLSEIEGTHQVCTVEVTPFGLTVPNNAPVHFQWISDGRMRTFIGYVDTPATAMSNDGYRQLTQLHCLGATSIARDQHQRQWVQTKPYDIAAEVVGNLRLGLYVDAYPEPLNALSQSGMSDWQLLRALASRIGYSLVANNNFIYLIDPVRERRRMARSETPVLSIPGQHSTGTCLDFAAIDTNDPIGSGFQEVRMQGTDRLGNVFAYSTEYERRLGDPKPTVSVASDRRFESLGQAITEARRVRRQARWTSQAMFSCVGSPVLRPGRYVALLDPQRVYSGDWYVTQVEHQLSITADNYQCALTVCRDATMDPPTVPEDRFEDNRVQHVLRSNMKWTSDRSWLASS